MTAAAGPAMRRSTWLTAVLALGAALSYAAWLGWDQKYQVDPVTGISSGPYEVWQVAGCAITVGMLSGLAGGMRRPGLALAVIPSVFTLLWALDAARKDDSGLWVVGAVLVAGGLLAAVAAVAYLVDGLFGWRDRSAGSTA